MLDFAEGTRWIVMPAPVREAFTMLGLGSAAIATCLSAREDERETHTAPASAT